MAASMAARLALAGAEAPACHPPVESEWMLSSAKSETDAQRGRRLEKKVAYSALTSSIVRTAPTRSTASRCLLDGIAHDWPLATRCALRIIGCHDVCRRSASIALSVAVTFAIDRISGLPPSHDDASASAS